MSDQIKCCPIDNTFKLVGKKFTIHILRNMLILNQTRFHQFLDSVEGVNPKDSFCKIARDGKKRFDKEASPFPDSYQN